MTGRPIATIALEGDDTVQLASQDEYTLKAVIEILGQKSLAGKMKGI